MKEEKTYSEEELKAQETAKEEAVDNSAAETEVETEETEEVIAEVEAEEVEEESEPTIDLAEELKKSNDKYLRLSAEFDNYRKRTLKEKTDLIKNGAERTVVDILPILDDFDRAIKAIEGGVEGAVDGVLLIGSKFSSFLEKSGIKEIEAAGELFDTDRHEALTKIPAPTEELKGKVVDVIEKGYTLNDKVIRFAKVVVGE